MSSDVYFLGAVGLINSLRLQGHTEPIHLLDLGLTPAQRELLEPEVELISAPAGAEPWLMKTIAPLTHPAEVMVLIDVDMVVTRPLGELIETAREGKVVAFENDLQRFEAAWGELLDLGELEQRPYLCSGFVALGSDPGIEVLETMADRQGRVDFERSFFASNDPDYPLLYLDQDVLNAVLAARVERERVESLPLRMAPMPPFEGLRMIDAQALACGYGDGERPWLVHHFGVKPWTDRLHDGVYARLLRRLLVGPGLAISVPPAMLPSRLRDGVLADVERRWINAGHRARWHLLDPVRTRFGRQRA